MTELAARLQAYVEAVEGKPVEWGRDDCTSFAAEWVETASGVAVPRLPFTSRDAAQALIARHGGLVAIWDKALSGFAERYARPRLGDVAIVDTSHFGQVGVIVASDGVALWRAANGTALLRPRQFVKVWAVTPDD